MLGKILSERLGYPYYDKELLAEAAGRSGLNQAIFERNDERAPGFLAGVLPLNMGYSPYAWYTGPGTVSEQNTYRAQSDFITETARKGPAIFVGRTSDYILRDFPGLVSIFLTAPEDECIKRILARNDSHDPAKAKAMLKKTNRLRAEFYNFFTDKIWGDSATYHLTLDTSRLSAELLADVICAYVDSRQKSLNR